MIIHSHWQGQPTLLIDTPLARCEISLQGAQVLSFIPKAEGRDLLWCSAARLQSGRPVRGGIPICWPWFSRQGRPAHSVQHGFARQLRWTLESINENAATVHEPSSAVVAGALSAQATSTSQIRSLATSTSQTNSLVTSTSQTTSIAKNLSAGSVQVCMSLNAPGGAWPEADWPAGCEASVVVEIGSALTVRLITRNHSEQTIVLTQALHTYLSVGDVTHAALSGLRGKTYLDNLQGLQRFTQDSEWRFGTGSQPACDRIYLATKSEHLLTDPVLDRRISIRSSGSASTVVWNAGPQGILALGDVPAQAWPGYLCVEAANCLPEDAVTLAPGARTELAQTLAAL